MTNKVYKSAQGKMVDLGTIILKNEHVRAVGNMKVNARGDKIDSLNHVIETRTESIQRRNEKTSTNVSNMVPQSKVKKTQEDKPKVKNKNKKNVDPTTKIQSNPVEPNPVPLSDAIPQVKPVESKPPVQNPAVTKSQVVAKPTSTARPQVSEVDLKNPVRPAKSPVANTVMSGQSSGGLAGAIARSREIKQELDRTRRQQAQDKGLRKI